MRGGRGRAVWRRPRVRGGVRGGAERVGERVWRCRTCRRDLFSWPRVCGASLSILGTVFGGRVRGVRRTSLAGGAGSLGEGAEVEGGWWGGWDGKGSRWGVWGAGGGGVGRGVRDR